ncbi:hypothetical protein KM043_011091 [Ampulex compressa]|nr:hypothetical protein KM043_011091 [Ampulex compressa]
MQNNLRLELIRTEVQEAMADDKQIALTKHLDRTTTVLEALIQHMQSLQISYLSAYRVFEISHLLLISYPSLENFSNADNQSLSTHLQQADNEKEERLVTLENLIDHCSKATVLPKELHISLDDYWMRREEFFTATKNFKNFLNGLKLSILQMEKLQRQYNAIIYEYQQSRYVLECELPKVISTRLETLRYGFEKIADFYVSIDCTKQATTIFKIIREGLNQDDLYAAKEKSHNNTILNKEVCEKCKINCIKQQTQ